MFASNRSRSACGSQAISMMTLSAHNHSSGPTDSRIVEVGTLVVDIFRTSTALPRGAVVAFAWVGAAFDVADLERLTS